MDGVTILNSFEVATKTIFSWPAFWAGVIITAILALIMSIIFALNESSLWAGLTLFTVMILILSLNFRNTNRI